MHITEHQHQGYVLAHIALDELAKTLDTHITSLMTNASAGDRAKLYAMRHLVPIHEQLKNHAAAFNTLAKHYPPTTKE
jgi:hypothetical protein